MLYLKASLQNDFENLFNLQETMENSTSREPQTEFNCTGEELSKNSVNLTEWSLLCNCSIRPQEYYSANYSLIGTLFQSIIFLVGVLGNILVS